MISLAQHRVVVSTTTRHELRQHVRGQENEAGWQQMVKTLKQRKHQADSTLIVMETTGTYWMQMAVYLHGASYAVSVVNPADVKRFGQLRHHFAKTDA